MNKYIRPTLTPALEMKLGEIVKNLESSQSEQAFWSQVVQKACEALSADAGTFFGLSGDSQTLLVVASYGVLPARLAQAQFPIDKGICGWIARNRQVVCINDVEEDTRFNGEVDLVTQFRTLAILGAPVAIPKRLYGVVEILNPHDRPFTASDAQFLEALGGAAAILFQMRPPTTGPTPA